MYTGRKFENRYSAEYKKRGLLDKVIVNKRVEKRLHKLIKQGSRSAPSESRELKAIENPNFYIYGDTYIYNNVYAVNFYDKEEIVGVEIENPEIVKVQKSIFDILWKIARPMKIISK